MTHARSRLIKFIDGYVLRKIRIQPRQEYGTTDTTLCIRTTRQRKEMLTQIAKQGKINLSLLVNNILDDFVTGNLID